MSIGILAITNQLLNPIVFTPKDNSKYKPKTVRKARKKVAKRKENKASYITSGVSDQWRNKAQVKENCELSIHTIRDQLEKYDSIGVFESKMVGVSKQYRRARKMPVGATGRLIDSFGDTTFTVCRIMEFGVSETEARREIARRIGRGELFKLDKIGNSRQYRRNRKTPSDLIYMALISCQPNEMGYQELSGLSKICAYDVSATVSRMLSASIYPYLEKRVPKLEERRKDNQSGRARKIYIRYTGGKVE